MSNEIITLITDLIPIVTSFLSAVLGIILLYKQGKLGKLFSIAKGEKINDEENGETKTTETSMTRSYIDVILELTKKAKTLTSYTVDEKKLFVKSHIIIWANTCNYSISEEQLNCDVEYYYSIIMG
jgi:hypothetical protein